MDNSPYAIDLSVFLLQPVFTDTKIFLELRGFSLLFRVNRLLLHGQKVYIFLRMHNTVNYIYMNEIMFSHTVDVFFLLFKKKKFL